MTDRTTKVTLIAQITNYITGMRLAAKETSTLALTAEQTAARSSKASKEIGTAFLAVGVVAAAGVALAIKEFADFDAKMAQLQTLSHATAGEMNELSDAALHAGQKIGFTATEVADAEIEMVKAGISVSDILGGALTGSLELAAAGQIDVAQATEIATIAMTQFGLKGKDIPHVADLLAAGADKALGSVADLGEALKSGGLVASQFGISLDDTIGTLSAFANAGLIGETAGTDLRQMLLKLANPSAESAHALGNLGIEVYNAKGQFVGLDGLAGQLHDKLSTLSQAQRNSTLATIFGSRAIAGANVLYKEGAKGIDSWNAKVNDQGFAAQQASGKMNNLEGDLKKLEAAFQTGLIESGSGANDTLRLLTQNVTGLVSAVGDLPAPALQAGLAIGVVVAVTSLLTGGFLKAVPAITSAKQTLKDLGISGKGAVVGIGAVAGAVTGLIAVMSIIAQVNADAAARTAEYGDAIDQVTGKSTKASDALATTALSTKATELGFIDVGQSAYDLGKQFGISADEITGAAQGSTADLAKFNDQMSQLRLNPQFFVNPVYATQVVGLSDAVNKEASALKDSQHALKQKNAADAEAIASSSALGQSLGVVSQTGDDAATSITNLASALDDYGKTALDARSANRDYEASIDAATAALKQNGATHDDATAKGRANEAAVDAIASKTEAYAGALVNAGAQQSQVAAILDQGRTKYIKAAEAIGYTAAEAKELADNLIAIPTKPATPKVQLQGAADALSQVGKLATAIGSLGRTHANVKITTSGGGGGVYTGGLIRPNGASHFASGGWAVKGRGTATSDSIPAMLSDGEYVNRAAAVQKYGVKMFQAINRGTFQPAVYQQAPQSGGTTYIANIEVPIQAGLIADKEAVGQQVHEVMQTFVRNGGPADWYKRS